MKKLVVVISLITMVFGLTAFQCSSTELTSAKLYINQENLDKALEALNGEVAQNPQSDEGFYLLGYVYAQKGEYDKMVENFDKSLAISQKFASEISQSRTYHWAENYNKGVALFNKASKTVEPDSAKIVFNQTIDSFENATICAPDSADSYINLAYAYLNVGEFQKAISPLEKLISLEESVEAYSRLGEIYLTVGSAKQDAYLKNKIAADSIKAKENYNKAIEVLEKANTNFPGSENIPQLLASAYIGANKLDVAMSTFKTLVEKEPENATYRYNYGSLLLNAKLFEEAIPQFEKAMEIDPNMTNAVYNLAVTYVQWAKQLREADLNDGNDEESTEYLEKYKLALPHLEAYTKTEEGLTNKTMWELLASVYLNLGMKDKAETAFQTADKL